MARQEGLEPPTFWFVAKHSIRLSYWRICFRQSILSQSAGIVKTFFEKQGRTRNGNKPCRSIFSPEMCIVKFTKDKFSFL